MMLTTTGVAGFSLPAFAQRSLPLIAFLSGRSAKNDSQFVSAFLRGLREGGFIDRENFLIDYWWADGHQDRLKDLAADLISKKASIVIAADTASALIVKRLAPATPMVFFGGGDPIKLGLVASLNQPGGHATGVTLLGHVIITKRLDVLRELSRAPALIAYFCAANDPSAAEETAQVKTAAQAANQAIDVFNVQSESEIVDAFETVKRRQANALLFGAGPLFTNNRQTIISLAASCRIPAIYSLREFVEGGGLASYGADLRDGFLQMGRYAGRIINGETPSQLPVVQPTKFELVINLRTANALGLTLPQTLLAAADELIE